MCNISFTTLFIYHCGSIEQAMCMCAWLLQSSLDTRYKRDVLMYYEENASFLRLSLSLFVEIYLILARDFSSLYSFRYFTFYLPPSRGALRIMLGDRAQKKRIKGKEGVE